MPLSRSARSRIADKLTRLYGDKSDAVFARIDQLADRHSARGRANEQPLWDERSAVLITYGDQIVGENRPALQLLRSFLLDFQIETVLSGLHILPFFPYSSDDGFSVIDYRQVDPSLGDWSDVHDLGRSFGLMFDFVVNHCSKEHAWFQRFLQGDRPHTDFFIDIDPQIDLTAVTRPRNSPLLTPFETDGGTKHVWTTFSDDQVDLNFASPDVLIEMLDTLLFYVEHGARVIRLDAIGFLWKTIGTSCIHLPETHDVVRLMRALLDDVAPGTLLLTETNVPHEENVRYFGDGDEANAVYQFSLAPLLLDAFLSGDTQALRGWLADLEAPRPGTTYFNFTASHDGIGVRPLEGIVPRARVDALVDAVRQRGGRVSMRRLPDGSERPYELNISYFSALDSPEGLPADVHARKFLSSQGVMLGLQGVPGIYFHSLVGTPNDLDGLRATGENRAINRRKYGDEELRALLDDESSAQRIVLSGYRKMLDARRRQAAFHPDAPQEVVESGHQSLIAFTRTSLDRRQVILVAANVGGDPVSIDLDPIGAGTFSTDLVADRPVEGTRFELAPYDIAWLAGEPG